MSTDSVTVADFCLFFASKTVFAQNAILNLWNLAAHPFNSMIVFLYWSWSFSTFNHNSCPFLYSFFFLKVWKSLSKIYTRTFALTWAPSPRFANFCSLMNYTNIRMRPQICLCETYHKTLVNLLFNPLIFLLSTNFFLSFNKPSLPF